MTRPLTTVNGCGVSFRFQNELFALLDEIFSMGVSREYGKQNIPEATFANTCTLAYRHYCCAAIRISRI
jgi:hypothetical protein